MLKNKVNTKVLSGFVELLPEQQFVFNEVKNKIENLYKKAGYLSIDTPVIEKSEVLFAKAGGDTEKQVYRFKKGDNDLSLRFDLTVPFARYVAEHYNDLSLPFKRYQIGKVFRGERAQKGRYREFYQADIDIVSEENLSIMYDVDIISTLYSVISMISSLFNLGKFKIKISNRKIWEGFFKEFNIKDEKKYVIINIIDKKNKMDETSFYSELSNIINDDKIKNLIKRMFEIKFIPNFGISIPEKYYSDFSFINSNDLIKEGVKELETIISSLSTITKNSEVFVSDLSIVRGLDYYTGTVFETFLDDFKEFGSISSGGRYEHLCDNYTDKKICGVGGSIGLSRLFVPLIEDGKITIANLNSNMIDVLILPQDESVYNYSLNIKDKISSSTPCKISIIYEKKKFKKLMDYANKINAKYVIIIGSDELANNTISLKNMDTGIQITDSINKVIEILNKDFNTKG